MSLREVRVFMKELAQDYKGTSYNLITRNCNHFCNDACLRLTGNAIPSWINRLARLGLLCNCLVPPSVSTCKVGIDDDTSYNDEYSKEKPRTCSSRFGSSSSSPSSSEKSTLASTTIDLKRSFGTRNFIPPSPFLLDSSSFSF
uniref:PPPDE domain-containing protein n=1 Tax=Tanacetum cinerariifolium TaxID=118510 RepID=A0A699LB57_TANCI|nr:hypothetical protein [Tanacetum cinerariifolium]